ncbi:hypothetical protein R3W88_033914 [Solanum pinnatisectum]|uniref:Uncharacterized protein n=1 Tax=Solanum pinnatisectum TaxID=50273 RepID=A0AAV9K1H2_9SOLN|nr:hypothetical protein R3W88_033914 [Solanum pinnatisectum]
MCKWMARSLGSFSEEIVREFYAFYAATLIGSINRRVKPTAQSPLAAILVCEYSVDISETTLHQFLF